MKARTQQVTDHGVTYTVLVFVCPGCEVAPGDGQGLHMLPVNTSEHSPSWDWDGDLERPTLAPSIKTRTGKRNVCHSFLRDGVFDFLEDSTHELAGRKVPMPDLYDWADEESPSTGVDPL